jgi:hypothetical protein
MRVILGIEGGENVRVRIYLYGVLMQLVVIADNCASSEAAATTRNVGAGGEGQFMEASLAENILAVLDAFGENFFRTIASDCFAGHEAVRVSDTMDYISRKVMTT